MGEFTVKFTELLFFQYFVFRERVIPSREEEGALLNLYRH